MTAEPRMLRSYYDNTIPHWICFWEILRQRRFNNYYHSIKVNFQEEFLVNIIMHMASNISICPGRKKISHEK